MHRAPILLLAALLLGGCAYGRNRLHDAQDVVCLGATVGFGVNANALVVLTGVGYQHTVFGLEDGDWVWGDGSEEGAFAVIAGKESKANRLRFRKKRYGPDVRVLGVIPWSLADGDPGEDLPEFRLATLGKIELAASVGVGLRVGVNPVELIDFVAGLFTLDLLGDDYPQPLPPRVPDRRRGLQSAPRR